MKTILTLLIGFFLITTNSFAQKSKKEPVKDSVTISIPATVVLNHEGKMLITDRYNKRHFEIKSTRKVSLGKEYEFILKFKISDRQKPLHRLHRNFAGKIDRLYNYSLPG